MSDGPGKFVILEYHDWKFQYCNYTVSIWGFLIKCVLFNLIVKSQHFGFHWFHEKLAARFLIRSYEQNIFNKR